MAANKSNIVTVKVKATIEVQFKSYGNNDLDEKAKEQIKIWVDETLTEEDQIPLFVATQAGEESVSKTVTVETTNE